MKNIEFDFNQESILQIVGEARGISQFNSLKILSCQGDENTDTNTSKYYLFSWRFLVHLAVWHEMVFKRAHTSK